MATLIQTLQNVLAGKDPQGFSEIGVRIPGEAITPHKNFTLSFMPLRRQQPRRSKAPALHRLPET
jgi:hypothetical protein